MFTGGALICGKRTLQSFVVLTFKSLLLAIESIIDIFEGDLPVATFPERISDSACFTGRTEEKVPGS